MKATIIIVRRRYKEGIKCHKMASKEATTYYFLLPAMGCDEFPVRPAAGLRVWTRDVTLYGERRVGGKP